MKRAPTFEEIFAVMSAAAVGDSNARVTIPENPDIVDLATRFGIAVNVLLEDLQYRSQEAESAHLASRAELERLVEERTAQFRQAEMKFASAFKASPAAISIASLPEGRWMEVNDAFVAMIGYDRGECIGKTSLELGLTLPEQRERTIRIFQEKGFIRNEEIQVRTKSGKLLDVLVSAEIVPLNGINCVLTIQYDISDLKRAEREVRRLNADLERKQMALEEANKDLESFSYSVAHDLRAPLRSIDGFSKMVLDGYADKLDPQGKKLLDTVRESAQRMADLIDDLLALSRVVGLDMHMTRVDLSAMAKAVVERLQDAHPDRRARITIAEGAAALVDSNLVGIAMENLLGNAWKFTSRVPVAHIEFGCRVQDGETLYFIRDNGAGFDMAYSAKLFGVFQRLHSMTEFEGTGIGLATVQRVISRHGGRVWGEGRVGEGATFSFTLGGKQV
jgi:PAS domain S-box-containing protein